MNLDITTEPTITVVSAFGIDKQLNKEQFVEVWSQYTKQLHSISWDHYERIQAIVEEVEVIAITEFDRIVAIGEGNSKGAR